MKKKSKPKILIGLPSKSLLKADMAVSCMTLCMQILHDYGEPKIVTTTGRTECGRNEIAQRALDYKCTHVLYIDSDMTFPALTARKLFEADKDIIGCNAAGRVTGQPIFTKNMAGQPLDFVRHQVEEVDFVGMAVTLIKTGVFKRMRKPWFFAPPLGDGDNTIISEDVCFCRYARKLYGYKIFTHNELSIEIGHIGDLNNTMHDYVKEQLDSHGKL